MRQAVSLVNRASRGPKREQKQAIVTSGRLEPSSRVRIGGGRQRGRGGGKMNEKEGQRSQRPEDTMRAARKRAEETRGAEGATKVEGGGRARAVEIRE